jgi:hypothetical protein
MLRAHALVGLLVTAPFVHAQDAAPEEVERGLRVNQPAAQQGYTLFSPLCSGSTFLIDMQGEVVHRWDRGCAVGAMAYLLDGGNLLRTERINENPRFFGGGLGGRLVELDWEGKVVWEFTLTDDQQVMHHGIEVMPNGHLLAIVWEYVAPDGATALGRDPAANNPKGWWPDAILELEPTRPSGAKVVWEWHAKDHLIQDFDREKPGFGDVAAHPELLDINADHRDQPPLTAAQIEEKKKLEREMRALGYTGGADDDPAAKPGEKEKPEADWMHTNAVDYSAELDLLFVSTPHLSEVFVIDHSTTTEQARGHAGGRYGRGGDLLYRWGNPRNWGGGTDQDRKLYYQHDVQWIRAGLPGAGHVLVFNNGSGRPDGPFSSVEQLALPFARERGFVRERDQAFGPSTPAWSYTAPEKPSFFSPFISGCQRLANGNTLICQGKDGRFFEVDTAGEIVWEYLNPYGGEIPASFGNAAERQPPPIPIAVFQALRLAPDHPGLRGRTLKPL